jgi:hypothetical protein
MAELHEQTRPLQSAIAIQVGTDAVRLVAGPRLRSYLSKDTLIWIGIVMGKLVKVCDDVVRSIMSIYSVQLGTYD